MSTEIYHRSSPTLLEDNSWIYELSIFVCCIIMTLKNTYFEENQSNLLHRHRKCAILSKRMPLYVKTTLRRVQSAPQGVTWQIYTSRNMCLHFHRWLKFSTWFEEVCIFKYTEFSYNNTMETYLINGVLLFIGQPSYICMLVYYHSSHDTSLFMSLSFVYFLRNILGNVRAI